jgi:hypothetical protein
MVLLMPHPSDDGFFTDWSRNVAYLHVLPKQMTHSSYIPSIRKSHFAPPRITKIEHFS